MNTINWNEKLLELFEDYLSPIHNAKWEQVKRDYPVGKEITGKVLVHAPFGIWVDVGLGFPALLEIIVIEGLTPLQYQRDDYCPVGECVEATISHYVDSRRQVYLKQTDWPRSKKDPETT